MVTLRIFPKGYGFFLMEKIQLVIYRRNPFHMAKVCESFVFHLPILCNHRDSLQDSVC